MHALLTNPDVISAFNRYHDLKNSNPDLYCPPSHPDCVNVVLPDGLKHYCNGASGTSGEDYVPVGIRKKVDNPALEISKIFSSIQSYVDFLLSSDCGGIEAANRLREAAANGKKVKKVKKVKNSIDPAAIPAAGNMHAFFSRDAVVALARQLGGGQDGGAALQAAIRGKTIQQVADEYGLAMII